MTSTVTEPVPPVGEVEGADTSAWRDAANGGPGQSFLARLADVDPALNDDRSLRRVLNTCLDMSQGKDEAAVLSNTQQRFSGGISGERTPDEAALIVKAATDYICTDL